MQFKPKKFDNIFCFHFKRNGKMESGISINLNSIDIEDEFEGEWLTYNEATKLRKDLNAALSYMENYDLYPPIKTNLVQDTINQIQKEHSELEIKISKLNLEAAAYKLRVDGINKNLESASMVLNHLRSNTKFIHHDYEEYFIAMTNCLGTLLDCMKEETE